MPLDTVKRRDSLEPISRDIELDVSKPKSVTTSVGDGFEPKSRLSTRVAPSASEASATSMLNSSVSSGIRYGIAQGLHELGLDGLQRIVEDGGGKLNLPLGSSLALRFSEKIYKAGDRQITKDEVRKVCDAQYTKEGRDVVWAETAGIAELGAGGEGTMALGALADAKAELGLKGIIRYRRLEPYETPSGTIEKGSAFVNSLSVPTTALLAKRMPQGGEFEISGEAHLSFNPQMTASSSLSSGPIGLSLGGQMGLETDAKAEVSITVQRLLNSNDVMVKIATSKVSSGSLGIRLDANLGVDPSLVKSIPSVGQGAIKYVLEKMGMPNLQQLMDDHLKVSMKAEALRQDTSREIGRYVFDLSKPDAQKAYEEIFSKFSVKTAQDLAKQKDSGVNAQSGSESGHLYKVQAEADLGETKLLLYGALQSEREGRFRAEGKSDVVFRESKFSQEYIDWFAGSKSINWESVVVKDEVKKEKKNFFHLSYNNQDRVTQDVEVRDFINFSSALGIKSLKKSKDDALSHAQLAKVFADRDDTQTNVDIYFTDEGIRNIDRADYNQGLSAHLAIQGEFDAKGQRVPFLQNSKGKGLEVDTKAASYSMVKRYTEIQNKWFFTRWWFWGESAKLEKDYQKQFAGRSIVEDAKALEDAHGFATRLAELDDSKDPSNAQKFFAFLGRATGFDYMKTIAAMAFIAGPNETLIHELSMSGGGVSLCSADEGEILHPEREVTIEMAKLA